MEFSEEVKAAIAQLRETIPTIVTDELGKRAAALNADNRVEMVFGREKKKIEELTGKQLLGQWYLYKFLAMKEPWKAADHMAKACMLSRESWKRCDSIEFADIREKALTIATEGADLTPVEYLAEMIEKAPEITELMPYVARKNVTSDTGTVPKEGAAVTVRWARTEGAVMTESDPLYGNIGFTAYEVYLFTEVSYMMLADSPLNVIADVTRRFTNALLAEQDKMVAIGSGTNRPTGLSSASITQSVALSNSLTFAGLGSVEDQLPAKYRRNARWIGHRKVIDAMKRLVDTQNAPIFDAMRGGTKPPTILGYPFSMQDDLPLTDVWLGDLQYYFWFDRMRLSMATDGGGNYFEAGTTGVKMVGRFDGKVALEDGFARGKSITGIS